MTKEMFGNNYEFEAWKKVEMESGYISQTQKYELLDMITPVCYPFILTYVWEDDYLHYQYTYASDFSSCGIKI